jgi:hypothetical protein
MPKDYKKEWIQKSSIDYFSPFIALWLACNSWYQSHYSELNGTDRDFINTIKTDKTGRNHLYQKYYDLVSKSDKDGISFKTNLELLHYALERTNLKPDKIEYCSFKYAVVDYNARDVNNKHIVDELVSNKRKANYIKLDKIYITNDSGKFFAGLFEIIYQVRNMLVHGKLNPDKDEHDVVKYCYMILWELMRTD